jgi:GTP cyclohydrolase I
MVEKGVIDVFKNVDLSDPHFNRTPLRMQRWLEEYTTLIPLEEIKEKYCVTFPSNHQGEVKIVVNDTYMLCPHHFLPVDMKIEIVYVPNGRILGMSKFSRIARDLARYPRVQEEYTNLLYEILYSCLQPKKLTVEVTGKHYCVLMRGIRNNSIMVTRRCSQ